MEIGANPETVGSLGGAAGVIGLLKGFWTDFCARQDKRELNKRIDDVGEEISTHAVLDAQTYATRTDQASLYAHIDRKFDSLQQMIICRDTLR